MEAGFRLQDSNIAIVGLGLMGGSLALALRGKCAALYGIDSDPAARRLALATGVVDRADADPAHLLSRADVLVLATPVSWIIDFIRKLAIFTERSCILIDLGSTKRDIVQAMSNLPGNFDPIGGHPICGKEKPGLEHAEASLFQNAPFVITPLQRTTSRAYQAARQIISAVGARPVEMDAEEHDRILAFTSHLPFLLSSALTLSTPAEYAPLIGTGFRSTSRLAGTSPAMMLGVLRSNRANLLAAIQSLCGSLHELESALEGEDFPKLELLLNHSRAAYHLLIAPPTNHQ
jgi:prephenate dehydrogenase